MAVAQTDIAAMPAEPGAYALHIVLPRRFEGAIGALGPVSLKRGDYLYLCSARGPGGISSRVGRHCRPEKKIHWHIDHLTVAGRVTEAVAIPGGSECTLAELALTFPGVTVPVPGFGSSDSKRCMSHLLLLPKPLCAAIHDNIKASVRNSGEGTTSGR